MRKLVVLISLVLISCSSNKNKDLSETLTQIVENKDTGVLFKAPKSWKVVMQDKDIGTSVVSKNGHGMEACRIGNISFNDDSLQESDSFTLEQLDNYFINNGVKRIEKIGKVQFLKSDVKKISGILIGDTHNLIEGSGVSITGFVKNLDLNENHDMTVYVAYSADVNNKAGVECSMVGKDKNGEFLSVFKAISKTINYKNEYYQ